MKCQLVMVNNINCPSCAGKLEKALQKMPGMNTAKISFEAGILNVAYDEDRLGEAGIREMVEQFGGQVTRFMAAPAARG